MTTPLPPPWAVPGGREPEPGWLPLLVPGDGLEDVPASLMADLSRPPRWRPVPWDLAGAVTGGWRDRVRVWAGLDCAPGVHRAGLCTRCWQGRPPLPAPDAPAGPDSSREVLVADGREHGPDAVAAACEELAGLFPVLERLAVEPAPPHGGPAGMTARPAYVPEVYGPAGVVLMTALEGVRRLEVSVRLAAGLPGSPMPDRRSKRAMTAAQTEAVLGALPRLAAGLDSRCQAAAARYLESQVRWAKSLDDIDEVRRWRDLPGWDDGSGLAPECPFCGCMWLRVDRDSGVVRCWFAGCPGDGSGQRPAAVMGTDDAGRPCITWSDGTRQVVPDLGG